MTLKKTTIPQLPVATTISNADYYILQQGSVTKRVQHETVVNTIENRDLNPIEKTYAEMTALVSASGLITGAKYLITDATTANINLIVESIAVNKIHADVKSPDFPQDVIKYDFENDLITWRWDTINDISVAQDLRNLQDLSIGTSCRNIHTGQSTTGSIGNNCTGITVGSEKAEGTSFIEVPANSFNIKIGDASGFSTTAVASNIIIRDNVTVTADDFINGIEFKTGIDVGDSPQKAVIYANTGEIWLENNDGLIKFLYITGSTLNVLDVTA